MNHHLRPVTVCLFTSLSLAPDRTGGPGYIEDGPVLTDGESTIRIDRTKGYGKAVGIESCEWPADLVVRNDMANERRYPGGTWTCGV